MPLDTVPLVAKVLQHLSREEATLSVLLVTPDWPAAPWMPTLLEMSQTAKPLSLGAVHEVMHSSHGEELPDLRKPQVLCWHISNKCYKQRDYLAQ